MWSIFIKTIWSKEINKYDKYFDFVRLKADLIGFYSSHMVNNKTLNVFWFPHFMLLMWHIQSTKSKRSDGGSGLLSQLTHITSHLWEIKSFKLSNTQLLPKALFCLENKWEEKAFQIVSFSSSFLEGIRMPWRKRFSLSALSVLSRSVHRHSYLFL